MRHGFCVTEVSTISSNNANGCFMLRQMLQRLNDVMVVMSACVGSLIRRHFWGSLFHHFHTSAALQWVFFGALPLLFYPLSLPRCASVCCITESQILLVSISSNYDSKWELFSVNWVCQVEKCVYLLSVVVKNNHIYIYYRGRGVQICHISFWF